MSNDILSALQSNDAAFSKGSGGLRNILLMNTTRLLL